MIAGSLEIELMANVARLQKDMQQARATVDNTFESIGRDVGRMKALLGTLFMGISVGNLLNAVNEVKEAAVQVERLAAMSRSSTDDFQKMAAGAKSVGIDMSKFGDIMKDVQDKVGDFLLTGEGELKDFFETIAPKVGVTAEQFRKLSGPEALQLFYTSLEKAGVGQMVMVNQMEAIADEASALAPLLANNGAELKRLGEEAQRTGAIMSTELIAASKNLDAELKQLQGLMTGITNTVMTGVMPVLASMADASELKISSGFKSMHEWVQANKTELSALWQVTKSIGFASLEVAASIGEILIGTGKWLVESGAVRNILTMVGLLIAGLKDGVTLVSASFVSVGDNIRSFVLGPIADFVHGLGTILQMTGASGMGNAFVHAASEMKDIGAAARQNVSVIEDQFLRGDTAVARFLAGLEETTVSANAAAKSTKSAYDSLGTGAGISAKATEDAKKAAEKAAEATKKLAEEGKKLAASFMAEESGLAGDFLEKWSQLSAAYKKNSITLEILTKSQARLLSQQPAMKEAAEAEKKAQQEATDAYAEALDARDKAVLSVQEQIEQERQAIVELGMSKVAIAALAAAKLDEAASSKERRAALADEIDWSGQLGETYRLEAKALRDLAALKRDRATKEVATDAAKDVAEESKRMSQQIEQSLTDALMRGFEGGKDAAKNMADTVENMFRTMVLRPIVQAIVQPVAGGITGALGLSSGTANAATGGSGGSLLSSAGSIGSLFGAGGIGGSLAAGAGWLTGATTLSGSLTAGASLIGTGTVAGLTSGIGMLAGALGPVAIGIAALSSIFGSNATPHMGAVATASGTGVSVSRATEAYGGFNADMNAEVGNALSSAAKSVKDTLDAVSKLTGAATTQYEVLLSYADDTSKDAAWGNLIIKRLDDTTATALVEWSKGKEGQTPKAFADGEQGYKDFMKSVAQDTKRAIEQMDGLPNWMDRLLKSTDTSKIDMDSFAKLMQKIATYPNTLLELAGTSRDSLVKAFAEGTQTSGATVAGQNVANMLVAGVEDSIYTYGLGQVFDIVNQGIAAPMLDALITSQKVSEALSKQAIDETLARATATAQALSTLMSSSEFQAALATIKESVGGALSSAAGAMTYQPRYQIPAATTAAQDATAKAAEDLAKRIKDALDGLKTDHLSLQIDLLRAQGNDTAATLMELNRATEGWDVANRELYRQRLAENAALKEQIRAQENLNAMRSDAETLAIDLLRAQGNEPAALRAERDRAVKGWTDLEIAQYDVNAATHAQIQATTHGSQGSDGVAGGHCRQYR